MATSRSGRRRKYSKRGRVEEYAKESVEDGRRRERMRRFLGVASLSLVI